MAIVFSTSKNLSVNTAFKNAVVTKVKTGEHLWSCGSEDVLVWHDAEEGDVKHAVPVCPNKYKQHTDSELISILDIIESEI